MNEELKISINETFIKLNEVLSYFPEINKTEANNSWTVGLIAEHIILFWKVIPQLFNGNTEKPIRASDEKIEKVKSVFLDFTIKMDSPDFIQPSNNHHNKEEVIISFQSIKEEILDIVNTQDLNLICLELELPTFGNLTKYEWIWFCIFHTQRHIHQLEKLKSN